MAKMIGACGVSKLLHNDENLISNLKPGFITLFVACDFCIRDYTLLKARTKRNKRTSLIIVRIVEKPLTIPQESVPGIQVQYRALAVHIRDEYYLVPPLSIRLIRFPPRVRRRILVYNHELCKNKKLALRKLSRALVADL